MSERNLRLVGELIQRIPEFPSAEVHWRADLPYDAFGTFALFLCREIRAGTTEEVLDRSFGLLNEMALSNDTEELNLLVVGVLEIIADDPQCIGVAERRLNTPGAALLKRVLEGWN